MGLIRSIRVLRVISLIQSVLSCNFYYFSFLFGKNRLSLEAIKINNKIHPSPIMLVFLVSPLNISVKLFGGNAFLVTPILFKDNT